MCIYSHLHNERLVLGLSIESFLQRQLALAFKCRNQSTQRKCQCKQNSSSSDFMVKNYFLRWSLQLCVLAYLNYVF